MSAFCRDLSQKLVQRILISKLSFLSRVVVLNEIKTMR